MRILSNPHTHTTYSDGLCSPEAMALRAAELGFHALGFSDHSVQRYDHYFTIQAAREAEYIAEIRHLAERYAGRMRIYAGVELDALCGEADRARYDYILLSAHYVEKGGRRVLVDSPQQRALLYSLIDEEFGGDGESLAERYFEMLAEAIRSARPHIVGHLDLVRLANRERACFDENSPRVQRAMLGVLEAMRESGALLEINTGGMARGFTDEPYPPRALWRRWREMGGEVIFGSDSHNADTLDFGFDRARQWLLEAGFDSVRELGGDGEALFVERPLRENAAFGA